MPVPTVSGNESQQTFIGRCMEQLVGEGKPRNQAYAICTQQWNKAMYLEPIMPDAENTMPEEVPDNETEHEGKDPLKKLIMMLVAQYLGKLLWDD